MLVPDAGGAVDLSEPAWSERYPAYAGPEVIAVALSDRFDGERDALLDRSRALMERHPLYPELTATPV